MTLRPDVAEWSLARWQEMLKAIYGPRNESWDVEAIWHRMLEEIGELVVPMARIFISEIQWELPDIFAWLCATASRVSQRSLDEIVWAKFNGGCPGCGKYKDCSCPDLGAAISSNSSNEPQTGQTSFFDIQRPSSVDGWQEFFGNMYGKRNADSQPLFLLGRLTEDVGRISRSLRLKHSYSDIEPRLASIFAWLCGICNRYSASYSTTDVSAFRLSGIMYEKYHDSCAKCHHSPCNCRLPLRRVAVIYPDSQESSGRQVCSQIEQELHLECRVIALSSGIAGLGDRMSLLHEIGQSEVSVILIGEARGLTAESITYSVALKGKDNTFLVIDPGFDQDNVTETLTKEFGESCAITHFKIGDSSLPAVVVGWLSEKIEDQVNSVQEDGDRKT